MLSICWSFSRRVRPSGGCTKKFCENKLKTEIIAFVKKHEHYYVQEPPGLPRIRAEVITKTIRDTVAMIKEYIGILWAEISERFQQFDITWSTCWSEAPAKSVSAPGAQFWTAERLFRLRGEMLCTGWSTTLAPSSLAETRNICNEYARPPNTSIEPYLKIQ